MNRLKLKQGTDELISISHNYPSLTTAQEISVYIDTPSQIVKTLGDGISNVTDETYLLAIAASDTANVPSGEYDIQARILSSSGSVLGGQIQPSKVVIRPSVWTNTD